MLVTPRRCGERPRPACAADVFESDPRRIGGGEGGAEENPRTTRPGAGSGFTPFVFPLSIFDPEPGKGPR